MFRIKNLTVKNFMSVGNVTQAVDFDRRDLTLVLGENLDLGGDDSGARNGTGKTTIINALSYGLYGQALTNIKKQNLINKTNAKHMIVTIDFEVNGQSYRIERGRNPTFLKMYVNGQEQEGYEDDSQGDSRETQKDIERLLGMSHDMFKHVVALNTYTEPFLSMSANNQRQIIEQLLGITILSEKAEALKEQIKTTKEAIATEEITIRAIQDANKRIQEQIEGLKKRQSIWVKKHDDDCLSLERNIASLISIDIDEELEKHRLFAKHQEYLRIQQQANALKQRQNLWLRKKTTDCDTIEQGIVDLANIDIDTEIENHRLLSEYKTKLQQKQDAEKWLKSIEASIAKEQKTEQKLQKEIEDLKNHKCYACGSEIHDVNQETILAGKQKQLQDTALQILAHTSQQLEHLETLKTIGDLVSPPKVFYKTMEEALNHRATLEGMVKSLDEKRSETDPYAEQITVIEKQAEENKVEDIEDISDMFYSTMEDALNHRSTLDSLAKSLESKYAEVDPYADQIADMENNALQEVNWDTINILTQVREHQDFLLKLLVNKDSFVRKRIIDQNLLYLNTRLGGYLQNIGLPHEVKFQNDLNVEITELGRDLDFDNLSRGERNRLILSLSWAFRDVWESLYKPINLLFIDELIDSGMDASGVENSLHILKKMSRERSKSIFLVSHRDELSGRVNNILTVTKENGFTTYGTDVEIV